MLRNESPLLKHSEVKSKSQVRIVTDRQLSKAAARVKGHDAYSKILPGLYLCEFPTPKQAKKMMQEIRERDCPVGLVISAVAHAEFKGMQTPALWKESQVRNIHVNIDDHQAESDPESMCEAVKEAYDALMAEPRRAVLMHCKAGQSRSTMLLIELLYIKMRGQCFDIRDDATIEDIIKFLKDKRPQIDIREHHIEAIKQVIFHYEKRFIEVKPLTIDYTLSIQENLNAIFRQDAFKRKLLALPCISTVKIYASEHTKDERLTIVNDLMRDISTACDAEWFFDFLSNGGEMRKLVDFRPQGEGRGAKFFGLGYSEERKTMHDKMTSDLLLFVSKETGYTPADIEAAAAEVKGPKRDMDWRK